MIAYLLLILLVAILAYFEARMEKRMIDARPGGPDLDHKELIWRRLRNVGALVMVAVVFDGTEGWDALWMWLCHAGAAWATFTFTHRMSLNLRRGKDWRYIDPKGNRFDGFWFRTTYDGGLMEEVTENHDHIYNCKDKVWYKGTPNRELTVVVQWYREQVWRGGLWSYIAIALVLAASIVGVVAILT